MKDIYNIKEKGLPQPEFKDYNGFLKQYFMVQKKMWEKLVGGR
jgi:hypothetical protein